MLNFSQVINLKFTFKISSSSNVINKIFKSNMLYYKNKKVQKTKIFFIQLMLILLYLIENQEMPRNT